MAIDRAALLRNAEKLVRQGKLESAIAEYLRVVDLHASDWATANALGDLYVRVGQSDKAVEQFARVAACLIREGFLSKASAVYKKIIRIRPDDEDALLQSGEIAAKQGLLVEARGCLNAVAGRRLARGDGHGAAELRIRLGALDPADFSARHLAAYARIEMDDKPGALRELRAMAADLVEEDRLADAIRVLGEAAGLDPGSDEVRRELFAAYLAAGDLERAREYAGTPDLTHKLAQAYIATGDTAAASEFMASDTDGTDVDVLLQVADRKLRGDAVDEGLGILRRLLNQDSTRAATIVFLGCELGRANAGVGFRVVDMAAETAVIEADWPTAAAALQDFVKSAPNHVPALLRLVEICVDGGLQTTLNTARAQLADAYLSSGAASEARGIAEDLVRHEPGDQSHIKRLRRALALLSVENPDAVVAACVGAVSEADAPEAPSEWVAAAPETAGRVGGVAVQSGEPPGGVPLEGDDEIDLTAMLEEFEISHPVRGEILPDHDDPLAGRDVDGVLQYFRGEAARRPRNVEAEQEYARGIALLKAGRTDEGIQALRAASRAPMQRFRAASTLGRFYRDRGAIPEAIEWFERAAEVPAPTPDEARALLYDLAVALEAAGELARALAVCLELRTDAGEYSDVTVRINRLTKAQARG